MKKGETNPFCRHPKKSHVMEIRIGNESPGDKIPICSGCARHWMERPFPVPEMRPGKTTKTPTKPTHFKDLPVKVGALAKTLLAFPKNAIVEISSDPRGSAFSPPGRIENSDGEGSGLVTIFPAR